MDFYSFVEGPLLWAISLIFIIGVLARLSFFFLSIIRSAKAKETRWTYDLAILGRFFGPFHMAALKKPVYAVLRYAFHICIVLVPVWLSGHITLWEESRFEWS
jgi:hypothetical protein